MSASPERVAELFELREGGVLVWKRASKFHPDTVGIIAGCRTLSRRNKSYWAVQIDGRKYKRSRLVFCLIHGRWPDGQIDHVDGNSLNDEPSNLREATAMQNAWNHRTRSKRSRTPMGVRPTKDGRFQARIAVNHVSSSLGTYATSEEAERVYQDARRRHFGEFA